MEDVTKDQESELRRGRPRGGRMFDYKRKTKPRDYRGSDSPEAKRAAELRARGNGHVLKLMPCKPFKKSAKSRRVRKHTWVRI